MSILVSGAEGLSHTPAAWNYAATAQIPEARIREYGGLPTTLHNRPPRRAAPKSSGRCR